MNKRVNNYKILDETPLRGLHSITELGAWVNGAYTEMELKSSRGKSAKCYPISVLIKQNTNSSVMHMRLGMASFKVSPQSLDTLKIKLVMKLC